MRLQRGPCHTRKAVAGCWGWGLRQARSVCLLRLHLCHCPRPGRDPPPSLERLADASCIQQACTCQAFPIRPALGMRWDLSYYLVLVC